MPLSIIVAVDRDLGIARDGKIPWHLPNDLKYFKEKTEGHVVMMGRKTFESIGKPLPNRKSVIFSRQPFYKVEGATVLDDTIHINYIANIASALEQEVFVIGGSELIHEVLPIADTIYLTYIRHVFECDTFLHPLDFLEWEVVSEVVGEINEKNPYEHTFFTLKRKFPIKG